MNAIIATPAQSGIDPGGPRASLGMVSAEPERSFADYLEGMQRAAETHDAAPEEADPVGHDTRPDGKATRESSRVPEERDTSSGKTTQKNDASRQSRDEKTARVESEPEKKPPSVDEKKKHTAEHPPADEKTKETEAPKAAKKSGNEEDAGDIVPVNGAVKPEPDKKDDPEETIRRLESAASERDADETGKQASKGRSEETEKADSGGRRETASVSAEEKRAADMATQKQDVVVVPETSDSDTNTRGEVGKPIHFSDLLVRVEDGDQTDKKPAHPHKEGVPLTEAPEESGKPTNESNRETRRSAESGRSREARADIVREITVNLTDETEQSRADKTGSDVRELLVRLDGPDGPGANGSGRSTGMPVPDATGRLARQLNGSLGDNIVRQARMILRNSEQGEIRLVIRPPELGRVRIQIQMDQGHIAGRILVDNQNVRQAIEQNLAALQRAFQEAGLEMGDLEVSTGDARQETGSDPRQTDSSGRSRDTENGAEQFGKNVKVRTEYDYGRHRINLVA